MHLLRMPSDKLELGLVVASALALHIDVKHSMVQLPHNALRAREHRRVVVQEVHPVMNVHPVRFLVRNVAYDHRTVALGEFEQTAQRVMHGDAERVEMLSGAEEKLVCEAIFYRMIDLSGLYIRRQPQGQRRDPFPVAIMP